MTASRAARRGYAAMAVATLALTALAACGADPAEIAGPPTTTAAPTTTAPPTTVPQTAVPPSTSPVAVEPNGDVVEVLAVDNSFRPVELTIAAGTEVHWVNRGRNDHNIIPEDLDLPWRVDTEDFEPGDEASFAFTRAGTYRYYCTIHGTIDAGMPGVIIVE